MSKCIDFTINLLLIVIGVQQIIQGQIPEGAVFITLSVLGVEKISTTYKNLKR